MNSCEQNNRDEVVKTILLEALTWSFNVDPKEEDRFYYDTSRQFLRDIVTAIDNGGRYDILANLDTVASMFRGLGYRFKKVHFLIVTALEVYQI